MIGLISGVIRMILDFVYIAPSCGEEDNRPSIIKNVNLFHSISRELKLTNFVKIKIGFCFFFTLLTRKRIQNFKVKNILIRT